MCVTVNVTGIGPPPSHGTNQQRVVSSIPLPTHPQVASRRRRSFVQSGFVTKTTVSLTRARPPAPTLNPKIEKIVFKRDREWARKSLPCPPTFTVIMPAEPRAVNPKKKNRGVCPRVFFSPAAGTHTVDEMRAPTRRRTPRIVTRRRMSQYHNSRRHLSSRNIPYACTQLPPATPSTQLCFPARFFFFFLAWCPACFFHPPKKNFFPRNAPQGTPRCGSCGGDRRRCRWWAPSSWGYPQPATGNDERVGDDKSS